MTTTTNLTQLLDRIKNNALVLPDFQRKYVWIEKDEKMVNFISSVLAQIPVGSIITFKDDPDTFANKEIGYKNKIEIKRKHEKVNYLLDGQQRVTTLSIVFSNRIFDRLASGERKVKDLLSRDRMRVRYFLKLPAYNTPVKPSSDLFNYCDLCFPFENNKANFCTADVHDLITSKYFNNNENGWFGSSCELSPDKLNATQKKAIIDGAVNDNSIPLYLIVDNRSLLESIIRGLAEKRANYLKNGYDKNNIHELSNYIGFHPKLKSKIHTGKNGKNVESEKIIEEFCNEIDSLATEWSSAMSSYLCSCMDLILTELEVSDGAERAINIYETINLGGMSLTTFDLIIAKAAKMSPPDGLSDSYLERIESDLAKNKTTANSTLLQAMITDDSYQWNSADLMNTMSSEGKINSVFIKQFLSLLCIISSFGDKPDNISDLSTDYCKEQKQLKMTSEEIWAHSEIALNSVIDALMIMQLKYGIFNLSAINYNLMILPIAYACFLMRKENFNALNTANTIKKLTAWYWYSIFGGEYEYDQSANVIKHIKWIHKWVKDGVVPEILSTTKLEKSLRNILNVQGYNDFEVLAYLNSDNYPKTAVAESIWQYCLSKEPCDFVVIKDDKGIEKGPLKAKNNVSNCYEDHHMIPLASGTNIGETSKQYRDQKVMLNSPLNRAYISKDANRLISSKSIDDYINSLPDSFCADYFLPNSFKSFRFHSNNAEDKKQLKLLLEERYNLIKSSICRTIRESLN